MPSKPRIASHIRRAGAPALTALVAAVFIGYALFGANGLLAYGDYARQLHKRQGELAKLDAQRSELRNRVDLLDPRHANPDMVDELVRKQLNVAHPDEVILPLK